MHPASECIEGREGMWKTADGSDCGGEIERQALLSWWLGAILHRCKDDKPYLVEE